MAFNEPIPADRDVTIGEKYGKAMKVATKEEAEAYLKVCIDHTLALTDYSPEEARAIEMQNIGYYAGYYDRETFKRVMELYETAHPIFGSDDAIYNDPADAYDKGLEHGGIEYAKNKANNRT